MLSSDTTAVTAHRFLSVRSRELAISGGSLAGFRGWNGFLGARALVSAVARTDMRGIPGFSGLWFCRKQKHIFREVHTSLVHF